MQYLTDLIKADALLQSTLRTGVCTSLVDASGFGSPIFGKALKLTPEHLRFGSDLEYTLLSNPSTARTSIPQALTLSVTSFRPL